MPVDQNETRPESGLPVRSHCLTLDNRRELNITGVMRVLNCDENGATLQTPLGNLTVGGAGIQVSEVSVRTGEVHITGKVEYLQYAENKESAGGFFARLFH